MARRLTAIFRTTRPLMGIIIIIVLFRCPLSLWGLDPDRPVDEYLLDKWEISAGIPSDTILAITQTPDGYLWIATKNGLVRFDGMKFSPIPFADDPGSDSIKKSRPDTLFVDREGILWFESAAGLTSYRHQTRRFHTFTAADGLTGDNIRHIKDDMKGNLWVCFHATYVNRFFNGAFTAFNASHGLEGKKINAIVEDRNGNLLFASRENGVFTYKDGRFFKYSVPGLDMENVYIIRMYEDHKGELWICTSNGLFRVIDKKSRRYTARDGLSDDFVTYINEDSDRNLWVGTQKGLNRIKRKADGTICFEPLSRLKHFTITCVFEDREKSLWIGTNDSGIRRLKEGKFTSYEPLEAHREEMFFSLFEDSRGDIWIGALGGKLFRCRGADSAVIESTAPPELSGMDIISIGEDVEGNLWLGTNLGGVFQNKNKTFVQWTTREGLTDNVVTSILMDSRGNIWLSTADGVSIIRGTPAADNRVITSFNSPDGLSGKRVHNIYEDKNKNIWIAADRGITVLKDGKIERENMTHYLQGISVTCIYEDVTAPDDDSKETRVYWLATQEAGLKRLTLKQGMVTSYTAAHGMASDYIYQFFEDQQENFWLMSSSGILRVSKNDLNRFADGSLDIINCTSFGTADGMKTIEFDNEYSGNSALKTRNGEFWFITKKGISTVDPAKVKINKTPPQVVIEAVFFNRRSIALQRRMDTFKGITDFRFHFTATTFLSPEKIKFRYRLDGFDREWTFLPPGRERVARYRDLEPGTYTFRVIACNSEGVWNRTGDSMTFILNPLFHQTFLFKAGICFVFILLAAAAFYIYKKRPFARKTTYKHKTSPPEAQFVDRCVKKLIYLMEIENLYRKADLSLPLLADKLSVSSHLLSQVLNEKLNQNFADFVNSYRIKEARKILQGPGGTRKKMSVVAFEVGFNTVTAFYNAFKKYTGMTPAQYKKKAQNKNKIKDL